MILSFKSFALAVGVLALDKANAEQHHLPRHLQEHPPRPLSSEVPRKYLNDTDTGERRLQDGFQMLDLRSMTPEDLVKYILGGDVTCYNVKYKGADIASGTFSGGNGIIDFDTGIVLTSGSVANTIGPNTFGDVTMDNGLEGDSDLDTLIPGYETFDASVLEFDFECEGVENLYFEYVFASEEYNEYVDTEYNDVFGFFLNGENVALFRGTDTPVAINNINCGWPYSDSGPDAGPNCNKYNNNDLWDGGPFFNTEMDGFTDRLVVDAPMNPGLNHIKLAVGDAGDNLLDSAVFIKAGSFSCVEPEILGDPHIKTWSNKLYDFHGVCDLVLLQNTGFQGGLGMDIHVRTKQMKQFSYVSSAALKIGKDILEVRGDNHDNLFWINKDPKRNVDNGVVGVLSGYPINYRKVNSKQHEFTVNIGGKKSITMKTFKTLIRVSIHGATEESFGTSLGLLGSYGSGKLIARDNSTLLEDRDEFGQEWQVIPLDGMLFHDKEGPQAPTKCEIPLAANLRRRLAESEISKEAAEIACAHVTPSDLDTCIFDVMATGEKEVAGAY